MVLPEHVHEPPGADPLQGRPGLGVEVHVVPEALGVVDVDLLRGDVEVPAEKEGFLRREVAVEVVPQAPKPLELVGELGESGDCPWGT